MTIVMRLTWEGVTPQQYDEVRRLADWVHNPADGGDVHVASFADGVLHCTDVWESEDQLDAFLGERIFPLMAQLGISSSPEVSIEPCHELFVPHINTITLPESDRLLAATPV
jgi:hypothetical protein